MDLLQLPTEVLHNIVRCVDLSDRFQHVSLVCKSLRSLCNRCSSSIEKTASTQGTVDSLSFWLADNGQVVKDLSVDVSPWTAQAINGQAGPQFPGVLVPCNVMTNLLQLELLGFNCWAVKTGKGQINNDYHSWGGISLLTQLTILRLCHCGWRPSDLQLLGSLTNLRSLDLSNNTPLKYNPQGLTIPGPTLQQLTSLNLANCGLTDDSMQQLLLELPQRNLQLRCCNISGNKLKALPEHLPSSLTSLVIAYNTRMEATSTALSLLTQLAHLDICGMRNQAPTPLALLHGSLTKLEARNMTRVHHPAFLRTLGALTLLQHLDLGGSMQLGVARAAPRQERQMHQIPQMFAALRTLTRLTHLSLAHSVLPVGFCSALMLGAAAGAGGSAPAAAAGTAVQAEVAAAAAAAALSGSPRFPALRCLEVSMDEVVGCSRDRFLLLSDFELIASGCPLLEELDVSHAIIGITQSQGEEEQQQQHQRRRQRQQQQQAQQQQQRVSAAAASEVSGAVAALASLSRLTKLVSLGNDHVKL